MNPDWDTFDARTRGLSARREADLIRDLATDRAEAARSHPADCRCDACRLRRTAKVRAQQARIAAAVARNRKAVAALFNTPAGDRT